MFVLCSYEKQLNFKKNSLKINPDKMAGTLENIKESFTWSSSNTAMWIVIAVLVVAIAFMMILLRSRGYGALEARKLASASATTSEGGFFF